MASTAQQKLSRDDWRKRKELEEARKAGTAPAEVDEEGRWVENGEIYHKILLPVTTCLVN